MTPAIPATLAGFTLMEALLLAGQATVDRCSLPANELSAARSYLHIAFQPFFIYAFAMRLVARGPGAGAWRGGHGDTALMGTAHGKAMQSRRFACRLAL